MCNKVRCLVCCHVELCQEEKVPMANLQEHFSINSLLILIKSYLHYIFAAHIKNEQLKIFYIFMRTFFKHILNIFLYFIFCQDIKIYCI